MRYAPLLAPLLIAGCSTSTSTPTSYCNSLGPVEVIQSEPSNEYKVCGSVEVKGHAVNDAKALNEYLLKEGAALRADAVLLLRKLDTFTAADGRVIKADAIAIQFTK